MLSHLKTAIGRPFIGLAAAGIAYYAFVAMVPLLASALLLFGLWADPATLSGLLQKVTSALPGAAGQLVGSTMVDIASGDEKAQGLGLLASLLLSLIAARGGAMALIDGLDLAFQVEDDRGFLKRNLLAVAITAISILGLGAVAATIGYAGLSDGIAGDVVLYLAVAIVAMIGAALLYRNAPDRDLPEWADTLPGAALFAIVWLFATLAFGIYVANFGRYNATYGSLGAIVVLLTWLWLSAYLLLVGAAFNQDRTAHCSR